MSQRKKKIVVMGGGTGTFTVLSGLKKYPVQLSAIVSMADDGGSTGVLREEFGVLPTGDVRRALIALSSHPDKFLSDLFTYRFQEGAISGHSFGNLILTALERITGSFEGAVEAAARLLDVRGEVIPVTYSNVRLFAELDNGDIIRGETNIDIPKHNGSIPIKRVWLEPEAHANPAAVKALLDADMIVLGPGDLYTSIIPNVVVPGIRTAFVKSRAKKVYVTNLMTKHGETNGFSGKDFVAVFDKYIMPELFDVLIVNTKKPSERVLERYRNEQAVWIEYDDIKNEGNKLKIIQAPLLRAGMLVRHDSKKLAKILIKLL
ncbi:MAG: gluconeogenesis factor YvcK family protein [Patescibacteria group bacterium]